MTDSDFCAECEKRFRDTVHLFPGYHSALLAAVGALEEKKMSTSVHQDKEFLTAVLPNSLLESAIDWIGKNMNPGDVFAEADLRQWARDSGFVEGDK